MMATIERLKEEPKYLFECNMIDRYRYKNNCDEWGCAFIEIDDIGVEYNFCIDNGENCCAIYKTEINYSTGYMETNCDTFVHYEIDFNNEYWVDRLEDAMCKALIKFFNL